jgi:hypothetical protein
MINLLDKEKGHQQLDFGFIVEVNESKHTPLLAPQIRYERTPAYWFDVRAKAAQFLVRASHEVFVPQHLRSHLREPLNPHTGKDTVTKANFFGIELDEIHDAMDIRVLSDEQSNWYDRTLSEDVVLVSMSS